MIFERYANMKYKFGNRKFWARGYFVDTAGKNEKMIKEQIQNQLQDVPLADQMSMKEFIDPFTGETVKQCDEKAPFQGQQVNALRLSVLSGRKTTQQHTLTGRVDTTSFTGGYDDELKIIVRIFLRD